MGISNLKPQGEGTNFENYNHLIAKGSTFNNSTATAVLDVAGEGLLTSVAVQERDSTSGSMTCTITVDGVALQSIYSNESVVGMTLVIPFKQSLRVTGTGNSSSSGGSIFVSYGLKK